MNNILERISCHSCCDSSSYRIQSRRINVTENAKSLVNKLLYFPTFYTLIHTYSVYVLSHTHIHGLASVRVHDASASHLPTRPHLKIRCSSHFLSIFTSFSTHCDQSASVTCHSVWLECHFLSGDVWVMQPKQQQHTVIYIDVKSSLCWLVSSQYVYNFCVHSNFEII